MNEEAIVDSYNLFVQTGYKKSIEEFKQLISSNPDALKDSYDLFVQTGYRKSLDDYKGLMGLSPLTEKVKKNDITESPSEVGSSVSSESADPLRFAELAAKQKSVTGVDRAEDSYIDPVSMLGMYPEKERVEKAKAQSLADERVTYKNLEEQKPFLEEQKRKEETSKEELRKRTEQERQSLLKSPDFEVSLSGTDSKAMELEESEAVKYFTNLYGKYGFIFRETGIGDALEVIAPDNTSIGVDLQTFFSNEKEASKLRSFVSSKAIKPLEPINADSQDAIDNATKVRSMRKVGMINPDGTESSLDFETAEINGKHVVFPTLFPKSNTDNYGSNPVWWSKKKGEDAYKEALKRGEVFEFSNKEDAIDFAEGSWQNINTLDAEAKKFYKERGLDYTTYKQKFDRYEEIKDIIEFLETSPFREKDLTQEQRDKFSSYYLNGTRRQDSNSIVEDLSKEADQLREIVNDSDFRNVREDFDLYLDKGFNQKAKEAASLNFVAKEAEDVVQYESLTQFGVRAEDLGKIIPKDSNESKKLDNLITLYKDAQAISQEAANKYEVAKTWLDAKADKEARGQYVENWSAISNAWEKGLSNGNVGNEILKMSLGLVDLDDDASVKDTAIEIIKYLQESETGKTGRTESRFHQAKGFKEIWSVFKDDPIELATNLAAQSISQMLPYGWKLIAGSTSTGIASGAILGSIVPGSGTAAGAILGGSYGLRAGFAATSVALEYTNAVMDAVRNNGYNPMNPEELVTALKDDKVWAEGKEIGLKRGLTIALMDILGQGLAGRVFKTGALAPTVSKIGASLGERVVFDPAVEAAGEFMAQSVAGQDISGKDIFAEALGGFGNNAPAAAVNIYLDARKNNNVRIANDFLDVKFMASDKTSDSRIVSWANNMEKLGQISAEQNQRIQQNVGLRREARDVLNVGTGLSGFGSTKNRALEARLMELFAAREELTSTPNRQSVFSEKISEINKEISEIATNKKLRPVDQQTILAGEGVVGVREQESATDIRGGIKKYSINGKSLTKAEFLSELDKMTPRRLMRSAITVDNDEETSNILKQKFDAFQKQAAGEVPVQSGATVSQEVEEGAPQAEPQVTAEEIVQEEVVSSKTPKVKPTAPPKAQPAAAPIIIKDVLKDIKVSFAPETAVEVEKGTREDTTGRKLTYNAVVTAQATDKNGTPIGFMTKRSDGEGKLSFTIKDVNGRNINKGKAYPTEGAARTALAEQVNKVRAKAAPAAKPAAVNKKASEVLAKYEKGTEINLSELETVQPPSDSVIKTIFDEFKKAFKNITIVGKRATEGAAFYDIVKKRIELNKNSTHWNEVSSESLVSHLAHEFVHQKIDSSENKQQIETELEKIKQDLIAEPPTFENESDKKVFFFITSKTNSPQEVLTYMVSNPELRKYLGKHEAKLNEISQQLFGIDVIQPQQTKQNEQVQSERRGDGGVSDTGRKIAPLKGAPTVQGATGPDANLVSVAEQYAADNGIDLRRQAEYVEVDEERAKRIADAYEQMANDPKNPKVKEAYEDLIRQTKAQYDALRKAGYEFTFFDDETDPYDGNPNNAMRDLRQNKKMAVYGTFAGYGTEGITDSQVENNPLLVDTGLRWKDQNGKEQIVTANDLFRAVHDAFGHGLEGSGFRARGEENAWQAHVRLFTGPAIGALTSETRGQNSWLNFGPFSETNKTAKVGDTVFAEQKIGLMPEWTSTEGRAADMEAAKAKLAEERKAAKQKAKQTSVEAEQIVNSEESSPELAERALAFFESLDKKIGNDLKKNANDALLAIPLTTLQAAVKAVKVLIKGGIAVRDAIRRVAAENKIDENRLREAFVALTKPTDSIEDTYEKYHVAPESGHTKIDVKGNEEIKKGETFGTVTYSNKEEGDVVKDSFSINDIDKLSNRSSGFITTARNVAQGFISIKPTPKEITEQLFGKGKSYKSLSDANKTKVDKERVKQTTQFKLPWSDNKALKSLKAYINKNKDSKPSDYYDVVKKKSKDIINSFKEEVKNNLRALYNNVSEDFKETSRQWYNGANRLAQNISESYGISLEQSAGILAALSPKNNWFNNISAAERVIRAWADHQNTTVTKEMVDRTIAYMERNGEAPFAKNIRTAFAKTKGRSISELTEEYKKTGSPKMLEAIGITMRIIDQSEYSPIVYSVSPEGFIDGKYGVIGWAGGAALSNAVSMLVDPSMKNISLRLGNGNKVRNFYGNIIDPQNAEFLTADTHAFAAGLMLPSSANEAQDFGLFKGGMSTEYAIFKDAYIEVAKEFGILPRELQSITWEAVRGSINIDNRTPSMVRDINKISEELLNNGESNENRTNEILRKYPIKFSKGEWSNKRGIVAQATVLGSDESLRQTADTGRGTTVSGDLRGRDAQVGERAAGRISFDEVADLDVKSKDNLAIVADFLDSIDRSISKRLRTNANDALLAIPLTAVQGMVKGLKVLVQGGMAVRDAIKKIAADNNISQDKLKELLNLMPIQEEFNALMTKADNMIARQKSRGIQEKKIISNAETMLRKEPAYINATDAQRKIMEREVRAKMGVEPRKAASIGRVIGALKDITNVTREEKLKIISRIRELGRDVGKELAKEIRAMKVNGQITTSQATNIISRLTQVNPLNETSVSNFVDYMTEVFAKVKEKNRQSLLKDLVNLVSAKAKTARTESGKRRSKGLDAVGQAFFDAIKPIIKAAANNDVDALEEIKSSIDEDLINDLIIKTLNGQEPTTRERVLLDQSLAYDTFADLANMDIDQIQELYNQLKDKRTESIANLKSRRIERAKEIKALHEEAEAEIKAGFNVLYNEDGTLKDDNQLIDDRKEIWNSFRNLKIWDGVKKWGARYDFNTVTGIFDYFRNNLAHLGTLSNILDKKGDDGFFTTNVYNALNDMDTTHLEGYYTQSEALDQMANKIDGITKGYSEFKSKMSNEIITLDNITSSKNEKVKWQSLMNQDQAMRIYALYKNPIQREKLIKMGFDEANMKKIEDFIGPDGKQMADMMVDYFSNAYYESVNKVYRQVNDVSLGYVENYFPTKTISSSVKGDLIVNGNFSGVFDAETAPSLKERTDTTSDVLLGDSFTDVVENHIQTMERYKAYAEGVKRLNAVFKSPDVRALLGQNGTDLNNVMKNLVNFAVNPNGGAKTKNTFLEKLMTRFTGFALAFKLVQIPKQATSFITAYEDYNFRGEGKKKIPGLDAIMFMVDTAKVIANLPSEVKKAQNISASFRDRLAKGLDGDVYGLESGSPTFKPLGQQNTFLGRVKRALKKAAGLPTVIGDVLGVMGYMVNYNRNIANGMNKADALRAFNNYNATQQSRRAADKIALQTSQDALKRSFTMFGSTTFLQMNKAAQGTTNIMRSLKAKKMPASKDIRAVVINVSLANVLFVAASNIAKFIDGDDEDRKMALKQMRDAALGLNLLYQVPLIGGGIELAIKRATGDRGPVSDVVNPYITVFNKLWRGVQEDDISKSVQPVIEIILGTQIDPFIGLFNTLGEGFNAENIYDMVGISRSYRPGYGSKSKSESPDKKGMTKTEIKKSMPTLYKEIYGETDEMMKEIRKEQKEILKESGIEYNFEDFDLEN
jgi:hypothetical protein